MLGMDLGNRQKGRMRADSVIDVPWDSLLIIESLKGSLNLQKFRAINPYGNGDTSHKIMDCLSENNIAQNILSKKFFDFKK